MFNKLVISLINIIIYISLTSSQIIRVTPLGVNTNWPDVLNNQNPSTNRDWRTIPNNDNTKIECINVPCTNNLEGFPLNEAERKLSNDGNYNEYVFGIPTVEASDGMPGEGFGRFATADEFPFKQQSRYCDRRPWLTRCKCFYMWVTYCWPDHNHPLCVCSKWCRWW